MEPERIKCPMCAERILPEARVCPFCHAQFVDAAAERREMNKLALTIVGASVLAVALYWGMWYSAYHP